MARLPPLEEQSAERPPSDPPSLKPGAQFLVID